MLEIVIVSGHTSFNTGGVGTHLRVLNDSLEKKEIKKTVVLGKHKFFKLSAFFFKFSKNRKLNFINNQVNGLVFSSKKHINKKTNVVDCHDLYSVMAAIKIKYKYKYKYKIVYTVHAPFYEQFLISKNNYKLEDLKKIKEIENETLEKCDGFVFVDDKQRNIIKNKLNSDFNYLILPNAVDLDKLDKFYKKNKENDYIIVSRHLFRKNGVHNAIQAFSESELKHSVKMIIVGMGDEYDDLKKLVSNLRIEDKVIFKGALKYEESIKYTANALMAIVPSISLGDYVEATSLSMLEAMALGVPLIASNIGGLRQVLENTNAGILVEENNIIELTKAMNDLYINENLRINIANNARKLIIDNYSSGKWLDRKIDFINSLRGM